MINPNKSGINNNNSIVTTEPVSVDSFKDIGLNEIVVFPTVFNPADSFSGKFLARLFPSNRRLFYSKDVLDMACGTGILGIVCAIHGAKSVTFTDISPQAKANVDHNTSMLGLAVNTYCGSLFDSLTNSMKFDLIIFNPPGFEGTPQTEIDSHYLCPYSLIDNFYALAPKFLQKGGVIISATSDIHDRSRSPSAMANKYNYGCELLASTMSPFGMQYAYEVQPDYL